jgi:hypothetical protein
MDARFADTCAKKWISPHGPVPTMGRMGDIAVIAVEKAWNLSIDI